MSMTPKLSERGYESKVSRVVIDTNVIISALLFGGKPGKLIPLWQNRRIEPIVSRDIIDEYIRVLAYPKFQLSEKEIQFLFYRQVLPYFEIAETSQGEIIISNDPSDDKFIQCALAGNAKTIVSGDSHLLSLKTYQDIHILSPAEYLKITT